MFWNQMNSGNASDAPQQTYSAKFKYAAYLTVHCKKSVVGENGSGGGGGGSSATTTATTGSSFPSLALYGLWRMDSKPSGDPSFLIGEGTIWMSNLNGSLQARGTGVTVATGLFGNAMSQDGTTGQTSRLDLATYANTFPYTGKTLYQSMQGSSTGPMTLEFFFKIIDTRTAIRVNLMAIGEHVYYNGYPSFLLINLLKGGGAWQNLQILVGTGSDHSGGYVKNSQTEYLVTAPVSKNIADNNWHHFALVKPGANSLKVFIDGIQYFSNSSLPSDAAWFTNDPAPNPDFYPCTRQPDLDNNAESDFSSDVDTVRIVAYEVYTGEFTNPVLGSDLISSYSSDAYYANVALLLPMNGTNGSTAFTDYSLLSKTVTTAGNTSISTAQYKWGGASGYFDGNGDYLSVADAVTIDLSLTNFTIEAWVYYTGTSGTIFNKDGVFGTSYPSYGLAIASNTLVANIGSGNGTTAVQTITASVTLPQDTWVHIAFVKNGTTLTIYQNGVNVGSATQTVTIINGGKALLIGYQTGQPGSAYLNGYIDDFRLTKGIARYTSSFTPPTASFPFSS